MPFFCRVFGHKWRGCRCERCGQQRDEHHLFEPVEGKCEQVCSLCGKAEALPCEWHHCACVRCGNTRDKHHDWMNTSECEQVCRICGKERSRHSFQPVERGVDRCERCGKTHRLTSEEIALRDEQWSDDFADGVN